MEAWEETRYDRRLLVYYLARQGLELSPHTIRHILPPSTPSETGPSETAVSSSLGVGCGRSLLSDPDGCQGYPGQGGVGNKKEPPTCAVRTCHAISGRPVTAVPQAPVPGLQPPLQPRQRSHFPHSGADVVASLRLQDTRYVSDRLGPGVWRRQSGAGPSAVRAVLEPAGWAVRPLSQGPQRNNGRIERSHRTEDEEFYRPLLLAINACDEFLA
jgi:hypothetical protein